MQHELISLFYRIKVWDKDGLLIYAKRAPAKSTVRAFSEVILAQVSGTVVSSINTAGGVASVQPTSSTTASIFAQGLATVSTNGIVIGTDATAVDIADDNLVAQIAHGTGAGQMSYAAQSGYPALVIAGSTASCTFSRNFNNTSGGDITVREIGIYMTSGGVSFCIVRDTPASVLVPNGGAINVEYTLQISV